jgi:hypothetical protein
MGMVDRLARVSTEAKVGVGFGVVGLCCDLVALSGHALHWGIPTWVALPGFVVGCIGIVVGLVLIGHSLWTARPKSPRNGDPAGTQSPAEVLVGVQDSVAVVHKRPPPGQQTAPSAPAAFAASLQCQVYDSQVFLFVQNGSVPAEGVAATVARVGGAASAPPPEFKLKWRDYDQPRIDIGPGGKEALCVVEQSPAARLLPALELVGPTGVALVEFSGLVRAHEHSEKSLEIVVEVNARNLVGSVSCRLRVGFERVGEPRGRITEVRAGDRLMNPRLRAVIVERDGDEALTKLEGAERDRHYIDVVEFATQLASELMACDAPLIDLDRPTVKRFAEHFVPQGALLQEWNRAAQHREDSVTAIRKRAEKEAAELLAHFGCDPEGSFLADLLYVDAMSRGIPNSTFAPHALRVFNGLLLAERSSEENSKVADVSDLGSADLDLLTARIRQSENATADWAEVTPWAANWTRSWELKAGLLKSLEEVPDEPRYQRVCADCAPGSQP